MNQKAYNFFLKNAGFSYDPQKETKEQGRYKAAFQLACAEEWARDKGYVFHWQHDDQDSTSFCLDHEDGGKYCDPYPLWRVEVYDSDGRLASVLGGIDFGRDGQPFGDPYRRVCEAELAAEEYEATKREQE